MTFRDQRGERSFRRRGRAALAVAATLILCGLSLTVSSSSASAAPFGISTAADSFFTGSVTVSGSKEPGTYVQVTSPASDAPHCIVPGTGEPTDSETWTWTCTFPAPSGQLTVSATQYAVDGGAATGPLSVTVRNLTAPTINGSDLMLTAGLISGTAMDGATVIISAGGQQFTTTAPGGMWSYPLPLSSGTYSVTAMQQWPGTSDAGPSTTRSIIIDKDPPPLPTFTLPVPGSTAEPGPMTFSGAGEDGGRVDVFVDGVAACSSFVGMGVWSCAASGITDGERSIQAIQWDLAGNASGATAAFTLTIATPAAPPAPPAPPTQEPVPPAPVTPEVTPPAPEQPTSPTTPPITPQSPSTEPPSQAAPTIPFLPPPVGGVSGLPPAETWGTPTDYGAAIPDLFSGTIGWGWALLLGFGFVVLIGLPLRLLTTVMRGRVQWRFWRRRERDEDEPPLFGPWTTAALALGAAVVLAAVAGGIQGEVRYARLVLAIGIALVVLNGLAVAVPTKVTNRTLGTHTGIRLIPLFLTVAAVTAVVSRVGGIQPPIIVGVVIAASFASGFGARGRGIVSLAQVASVAAVGCLAWLGQSALGPQIGFWGSLLSETLAATAIAGVGSLMLLLLPVAGMPGRYIFEWSRIVWGGSAIVGSSLAAALVALSPSFPLFAFLVGCALFAAVCVAAWAWLTYVQPQLEPSEA
ncbi:MAG: hypothetical protein ACOH19_14165 [Rhodoglobus sp.]